MILHLSRMRRNVNRNVYNAGKNVSATKLKDHNQWRRVCVESSRRVVPLRVTDNETDN